jgi:hypothetical protein
LGAVRVDAAASFWHAPGQPGGAEMPVGRVPGPLVP